MAHRELKMPKEVMESVWMARHLGGSSSVAAHLSTAKIVNASLKKTLNCFSALTTGSAMYATPCIGDQKAKLVADASPHISKLASWASHSSASKNLIPLSTSAWSANHSRSNEICLLR